MHLYLVNGVSIEQLQHFGFKDTGNFYMWSNIYENALEEVLGQEIIKIDKESREVTFIFYGKCDKIKQVEDKAIKMYDYGLIAKKPLTGREVIPKF